MNRIEKTFAELRKAGRKALVGYLTAGDPTIAESERNIQEALENGLDILELGVPFSDPTADGPTIQAASQRALAGGMTLEKTLTLAGRLRKDFETPIVLFGYSNPFFGRGYERVSREAAEAGVDGLLIVDLPFEEKDEFCGALERQGLCYIPLVAPTTSPERAKRMLKGAQGFVYYIMVKGVTGARARLAADAAKCVKALRRQTNLPIAAGFGVKDGAQARQAAMFADGVVVGSALVEAARKGKLAALVHEIREGLGKDS